MNVFRVLRRILPVAAVALIVAPFVRPGMAAEDATDTRAVSGFDRITLEGPFSTEITAGGTTTHVTITGDPALLSRITTEVRDKTLVVGMKSGTNNVREAPKLKVTLPVLRAFANDSAGKAVISGIGGGDFDISNDGTGMITASGRAKRLNIALDGTGKIDTTALDAGDVTVNSNGVGGVYVKASGELKMNVNGVGEIRYTGNPTHVESHVNGLGRISRM